MDYKSQRKFVIFGITVVLVISFILSIISPIIYLFNKPLNIAIVFDGISYSVINIVRLFFVIQITFVCAVLRVRFKALNETIKNSISIETTQVVRTKNFPTYKFLKIYHILCDGIDLANETFTHQILFLMIVVLVRDKKSISTFDSTFNLIQLSSTFAAYGVVIELLRPTSLAVEIIGLNFLGLIFAYLSLITIAHAGSSLTEEADVMACIISKCTNELVLKDSEKLDFIYSMIHLKARNINLENHLFVINWKTLLAVSVGVSIKLF